MPLTVSVEVPPRDREVLASWVRSPSIRSGLAQRARIVLLAADGAGTNEIMRRTGVSKPTVIGWKRRYAVEGIGGLEDRPKPGKPRTTDDVAVVLCVDEKPQAQALERAAPVLPARPGIPGKAQPRLHPARHHHALRGAG